MGLKKKISLVARAATLGNSANLHKSKAHLDSFISFVFNHIRYILSGTMKVPLLGEQVIEQHSWIKNIRINNIQPYRSTILSGDVSDHDQMRLAIKSSKG